MPERDNVLDLPILSEQAEADIQALAAVFEKLADYWDDEFDPEWDYAEQAHDLASVAYAAGWRPNSGNRRADKENN